ncbi:hypothetical protein NPIL_389851, partial [Nephila pilipes]
LVILFFITVIYSSQGRSVYKAQKQQNKFDKSFVKPEGRFGGDYAGSHGGSSSGAQGGTGKVLIAHEVGQYVGHVISSGNGGYGGHGGS